MNDLIIAKNNELVNESESLLKEAKTISVYDTASMDTATILLKGNKELLKKINNTFDPIIKKTNEAHKEAVAQKKQYAEIPLRVEKLLKTKIGSYLDEQRRKAEAEAKREQEEEQRKAEERRLAEAEELEKQGHTQEAQAVLDQEIITPKIQAAPVEKSAGLSTRVIWKYRITNINLIPREYMVPNETMIGSKVRTDKDKTNIPGIEAYRETTAY